MLDSHSCNRGSKIFPASFCTDRGGTTPGSTPSLAIGPITEDQWQNDMSAPIQKAVDYCLHHKIGTLEFRPNRYPLAKPIVIAAGNLTIKSTGQGLATSRDACVAPMFVLVDSPASAATAGIAIEALFIIQATDSGLSTGNRVGDRLIGNVAFYNVGITSRGKTTTKALVYAHNAFSTTIERCFIGGFTTPGGIQTVDGIPNVHVDMSNAHQGVGVLFDRNETVGQSRISWLHRIHENAIHWCTKKAMVMAGSDSWITGNYISHTAGLAENDFSGNIYAHNHIDTGRGIGDATGISFVERDPSEPPRKGATVISSNYIDLMTVGIGLSDATEDTTIIGNQLRANSGTHINLARAKHITVTGNTLRSVSAPGFSPIKVIGTPSNLTIMGNVLRQPLVPSLQPFANANTL